MSEPPLKKLKQKSILDSFKFVRTSSSESAKSGEGSSSKSEETKTGSTKKSNSEASSGTDMAANFSDAETSRETYTEDYFDAMDDDGSGIKSEKAGDRTGKGTRTRDLKTVPDDLMFAEPLGKVVWLFERDIQPGRPPAPVSSKDKWDDEHVKLPSSSKNDYTERGTSKILSRWDKIKEALKKPMKKWDDVQDAILVYNHTYTSKWKFDALKDYFKRELKDAEAQVLFGTVLPGMVHLVMETPRILGRSIPLLVQRAQQTMMMSQEQAACILANAFFCTFPRRNKKGPDSEYAAYPTINFSYLFATGPRARGGIDKRKMQKLRCLFNYFRRVTEKMPTGVLSFQRQYLTDMPAWETSRRKLPRLRVDSAGFIETTGAGMLQADFANKFIGGGVLGSGLVQEEIRFTICPELIVSRLFTECLLSTEVLIITGCQQFSEYKGYSDSFEYVDDFVDETPRDMLGRTMTQVVAMDALVFNDKDSQFTDRSVKRELRKAYAAFFDSASGALCAVATGNWGCGAFGGDKQLKALLQLMAAAEAGRDVLYLTFGDEEFRDELHRVHAAMMEQRWTVGDVFSQLAQYSETRRQARRRPPSLFEYLDGPLAGVVRDSDDESETDRRHRRDARGQERNVSSDPPRRGNSHITPVEDKTRRGAESSTHSAAAGKPEGPDDNPFAQTNW